jgi:hypothetical protein
LARRHPLSARVEKLAWYLFLLVILSRALSPDIIGILNNDSIHYLERAKHPSEFGLVSQGFRQAGYPLFLSAIGVFTDLTPYDLFFTAALVQRILLLVGLGYLGYLLRWWAAPALVFLSMPTLVTMTDLLLTEALSLSLAILLACLLVHASGLGRAVTDSSRRVQLQWAAGGVLATLVLVKFQYAAMLLPMVGVVFTDWRSSRLSRNAALMIVGLPALFIGLLGLGQAIENANETGEFLPVSESARAAWYSSYKSVFFDIESPIPQRLEPFYDDGDLYVFLHGLEGKESDYLIRREIIASRIDDLFLAAGTTHWRERWKALIGFLQLGPSDDIESTVRFIREKPITQVETLNDRNFFSTAHGTATLYATYNGGQAPSFLTTSAVALAIGPDDYRSARSWVLPLSIWILALSIFVKEPRWLAGGTLLLVIAVTATHAYYYTSNSRYTLPSAAFAVVVASAVLPRLAERVLNPARVTLSGPAP